MEPTVVYVSTVYEGKETKARNAPQRKRGPLEEDEEGEDDQMDLFRRFFRQGPGNAVPEVPRRREGTGSGFIRSLFCRASRSFWIGAAVASAGTSPSRSPTISRSRTRASGVALPNSSAEWRNGALPRPGRWRRCW